MHTHSPAVHSPAPISLHVLNYETVSQSKTRALSQTLAFRNLRLSAFIFG